MSHYPPNQGYYGAPQGGPPPGQYGAPPQGYPPQGHPQGYPPQQYPPQQQGGYPPPQQQGGYPPQQQGGYPPQQQGGYPPQQQGGYPPQQQGGYPPQQQGGYPQQSYPPPQQSYGAPAQPYGAPPVQQTPPSPGYDPRQVSHIDTTREAEALRSSMKGMGTKEALLIQTLTRVQDPTVMANLHQTFNRRFSRDLLKDIASETGSYFREGLEALVRGPLGQDVFNLNDAIKGAGTKEGVLNDVLLGRSNGDMNAIKQEYQRVYRRSLEADVKGDLSLKTERLFTMVLSANRAPETAPIIPQDLERDVSELHRATEGKVGTDQLTVCSIFSSRSDGQLRALSQEYQRRYARSLTKTIENEFTGHMETALLRMLHVAEDRAMADAKLVEETMAGAGTKDRLLVNRLVRIHWIQGHMGQVKGAYKHNFKKDLSSRVHGETSGDFRKFLTALVEMN